jgi:ubiquinone/menaquinone biosynthesis C-methylase UbiE
MHRAEKNYVPAAGYDWALPLYDPLLKLLGVDQRRARLVEGIALRPGQNVLDIGCGTGTLVVALKRKHPDVHVTGVDPDPKALAIAQKKAGRAQTSVRLDEGRSDALPYGDATFDHVVSSFMFHHLEPSEKRAMLREVRRVLKPGGGFHMLDFRDEHEHKSPLMHALHAFGAARKLRGQLERGVEDMLLEAGFSEPQVETQRLWPFGAVSYYRAQVQA